MKLWWPHCEALIAFLMAYSQTKKPELLERFSQVYEYTFSHVSSRCGVDQDRTVLITLTTESVPRWVRAAQGGPTGY